MSLTLCASNLYGLQHFSPQGDVRSVDWETINHNIQIILSGLTDHVLAEIPGLNWKPGRSAGGIVSLFSYRVYYHLDGDDYDPIVVGVTIVKSGPIVRISGDISGDESGFIYFWDADCKRTVEGDTASVLRASSEIAERLSSQYEVVIQAVRERHPRAFPR